MHKIKIVVFSLVTSLLFASQATALGPVDGEVILSYWDNQFTSNAIDDSVDIGSINASGEVWIGDNWGIRIARYENDLNDTALDNENRLQLDLRKRILSASDNNFFAFGVGAEKIDLINGDSSTGLRLSAEARIAITPLTYFYGRGAILPYMDDASNFQNLTGREFEFGVSITPFPFVSVKAGYLTLDLDYDDTTTGASGNTTTDGFLIGAGIHW